MNADENEVRQRAHDIWEREGRPDGRDREHWEQAEAELRAERAAARKPGKGNGAAAEKPAKAAPGKAEPSTEKAPARKQAAKTTGTAAKPKGASKAG